MQYMCYALKFTVSSALSNENSYLGFLTVLHPVKKYVGFLGPCSNSFLISSYKASYKGKFGSYWDFT